MARFKFGPETAGLRWVNGGPGSVRYNACHGPTGLRYRIGFESHRLTRWASAPARLAMQNARGLFGRGRRERQ